MNHSPEGKAGISGENTPPSFGVLFVHGMGEQQRGDTLLGFGEPIVKFLRRWVIEDARARPDGTFLEPEGMTEDCRVSLKAARERAQQPRQARDAANATDPFKSNIDLHNVQAIRVLGPDPNVPSHATIKVKCRPDLQPWLLAESWWATDFKPATFTDVLNWGVRVVPFVLLDTARYQIKTLWEAPRPGRGQPQPREGEKGLNISDLLQLAFTVILGPITYSILLLLMPVASIPFRRGLLGNLMLRLARSLGDPYLLLSSPIRLASMVERVHHDIRWLQDEGCTGIAIVAHSQGAAVAHHALRSFPKDDRKVPITRFVTIGAAIEKLHYLQQLDMRGKNLLRAGLLQAVAALGVLFSVLFAWRIPDWRALNEAWGYESLFLTIALWLLFTTLFWLGPQILDWIGIIELPEYKEPEQGDLWDRANHNRPGMPTAKWVDLYARADPVSLGPIEWINSETPHPLDDPDATSAEIRNQDSMLFDHTTYWQNTSQFMVPLVGGLCRDTGWDTDILDLSRPIFRQASDERASRLDWLDRAGLGIVLTVIVTTLALLAFRALDDTGIALKRSMTYVADQWAIPFEGVARDQVGSGRVAEAVLGVVTLALVAIAYHAILVKGAWRRWDDARMDSLLDTRMEVRRLAADAGAGTPARLPGTFTEGAWGFFGVALLFPLLALVSGFLIVT